MADEAERDSEIAWREYTTAEDRHEKIKSLLSILREDTEVMTLEELRDALPNTRAIMEKIEQPIAQLAIIIRQ